MINKESLGPLAATEGLINYGFGSITLRVYKKDEEDLAVEGPNSSTSPSTAMASDMPATTEEADVMECDPEQVAHPSQALEDEDTDRLSDLDLSSGPISPSASIPWLDSETDEANTTVVEASERDRDGLAIRPD